MSNTPKNIGEIYAERALTPDQENLPSNPAPLSIETVAPSTSSGPAIYGGTMPAPSSQDEFIRQTMAARNKILKPRKRSPFNLMITMIMIAIAIVLYVGNVIAVQQLLKEVSDKEARLQQILNDQEVLKAQINRMSSLERIRTMAEGELGLHNPKGPPQWIEIDDSKTGEVDQELSKRQVALPKGKK